MHRHQTHEIVIVGGGIAGAALGSALAQAGLDVAVLEASTRFDDRVRGESMQPWGVREADNLGLVEVLQAAGAHTSPLWKRYTDVSDEPRDIPVGALIPGIGGALNLHHPLACQALIDAAAASGAHVLRGVADVQLDLLDRPVVRFSIDGRTHSVEAGLVVGADGRASVVRRAARIGLRRQAATGFVAGLLLRGVVAPDDHDVLAEHDQGLFLMFHQGHGQARAYHVIASDQRHRYAGSDRVARFIDDATRTRVPWAGQLTTAHAAGPCAAFAGTDTWTEHPFADGVVLIGDAAGHNDPTAGCGLSIAMRDVRIVRDLIVAGARRAEHFVPYGVERVERMRRLRLIAALINVASVEPAPNRSARRALFAEAMATMDPQIFGLMLGMFVGPEAIAAHLVDWTVLERLRAA